MCGGSFCIECECWTCGDTCNGEYSSKKSLKYHKSSVHKGGKFTAKTAAKKSRKKKVAKTCEEFSQCGNFFRVIRHTLVIVPYWTYADVFL